MSSYNFKSSYSLFNDNGKCSGDFKAKDSKGLNFSSEATGDDIKEVLDAKVAANEMTSLDRDFILS